MKMPIDIEESCCVLDGSDLVNHAYAGLISLMDMVRPDKRGMVGILRCAGDVGNTRGLKGSHLNPRESEFVQGLLQGVYMPGTQRSYWLGNFDVGVDPLPDQGCVYCTPEADEDFCFVHVRRVNGFPPSVISQLGKPVARYKASMVSLYKSDAYIGHSIRIYVRVVYFAVDDSGSVWSCPDRSKWRQFRGDHCWSEDNAISFKWGPGALSLLADRRFLWLVETQERLVDFEVSARMQFGVDPEMIKSLFYSRSVPITATGRLRPILHWVESHKRRLREGIQVDVTKHLRGIERFEMGGLEFTITSPTKNL